MLSKLKHENESSETLDSISTCEGLILLYFILVVEASHRFWISEVFPDSGAGGVYKNTEDIKKR